MLDTLLEKANNLPMLPGVYIMLDEKGEVIYVGKAKRLKMRVTSYFRGEHLPKVAAMVEKVRDFNVIVAGSEFEALVLENSLIKRHKPHYNILLKDDKGYPFIRIDTASAYPRMTVSRSAPKDGASYFGPFGGRYQTREIIDVIRRTLLLPDCSRSFPRDIGKERPCLKYQMGSCAGWCLPGMTQEDYRTRMEQAALILEGRSEELIAALREKMEGAAEELRFEQAAALRDRIRAVEALSHKQRVISTAFSDTDAIGFCRGAKSCFTVLHFRDGDMSGKDTEMFDEPIEEDAEAVSKLVRQYYSTRGTVPKHILLPIECDDAEELETFLSESSGRKTSIEVPKRGERLLEAFDISNLGSTGIVAAMTVHVDGRPLKRDYRKFRIRGLEQPDDYASMYQCVSRRLQHYLDGDEKFSPLPDLMLIDGGREHAATALRAAEDLGLSLPIFGMVKDDRHRTRALVTPEGREIGISGNQAVFSLVGNIQEETHRSAIEYQRSLRAESYGSTLEKIPGVGKKRREELISRFKSVKAIREASVEELCAAVPKNTAQAVWEYFRKEKEEQEE